MASATKKTSAIRQNKKKNQGKKRKTVEQNQGTTRSKEELFS